MDALGKPIGDKITAADLTGLTKLEADRSSIANVFGLEYCTNLTSLSLHMNQISDISPLLENSGLGTRDVIGLKDNNLNLSEGSEDIGCSRIAVPILSYIFT